MTDCNWS